jgi:cytochrome c oxidase subunit IV
MEVDMAESITQPRVYVYVFAGLIGLTIATVLLAYVEMGPLHALVGLSIAIAKGILILLYFMHWLESYPMNRVIALSGLLWLGILIVMTQSDFFTRDWALTWKE